MRILKKRKTTFYQRCDLTVVGDKKMKNNFPIKILILSYLISTVAIFAIAFFIEPYNQDNNGFWYRVLWTEILNIIFWFGSSGWFAIGKSDKIAITPSTSIIITVVCILSFILMIIEYNSIDSSILRRYHIAFQIIIFTFCGLTLLASNLVMHYASSDIPIPENSAKSPSELADYLFSLENTLVNIDDYDNKYKAIIGKLKMLREKVTYSFQDNAKTRTNVEYMDFSTSIINFCNSFENSSLESIKKTINIDNDLFELNRLINKIEIISSSIKRS